MSTIKGPLIRLVLTIAHLFQGPSRHQWQDPLISFIVCSFRRGCVEHVSQFTDFGFACSASFRNMLA